MSRRTWMSVSDLAAIRVNGGGVAHAHTCAPRHEYVLYKMPLLRSWARKMAFFSVLRPHYLSALVLRAPSGYVLCKSDGEKDNGPS